MTSHADVNGISFESRISQKKGPSKSFHSLFVSQKSLRAHYRLLDPFFLFTSQDYIMQIFNKTFFAIFVALTMLIGTASSVRTTAAKLRRTEHGTDINKPVGGPGNGDEGIDKKKSKKHQAPSSQPSAVPSAMPSAQSTQKKSGKGMMSVAFNGNKPSY
jgi:hypothetical protein